LWVEEDTPFELGDYVFTVERRNNPVDVVPINLDELVNASLLLPTEVDLYSFNATSNQIYKILLNRITLGNFDLFLEVLDIFGNKIGSQMEQSGLLHVEVPNDGKYFIWVMEDTLFEKGNYELILSLDELPTVSISSPLDGSNVLEGETVILNASAQDDGQINSVAFSVDGLQQLSISQEPYSMSLQVPSNISTLLVEAIATDDSDQSATDTIQLNVIQDPLTTVEGLIIDRDQSGVSGATVRVIGSSLETISLNNGSFSLPGIPTVQSQIVVRSSAKLNTKELIGYSDPIAPNAGGITDVGELTLAEFPILPEPKFAIASDVQDSKFSDFNNDGVLDLFTVSDSGLVSIHLGQNNGTFFDALTFQASNSLVERYIAVGNINQDNLADVIMIKKNTASASLLINDGNNGFLQEIFVDVGANPTSIDLLTMNSDTFFDLITTNSVDSQTPGTVNVRFGNGDGTFQSLQSFGVGIDPVNMASGDFDNDGLLDLLTANQTSNDISFLRGLGDGSFVQQDLRIPVGETPDEVLIGQFTDDNFLDIVSLNQQVSQPQSSEIALVSGRGDGTFDAAVTLKVLDQIGEIIERVDNNHDGLMDITFTSKNQGVLNVLLNNGDNTFNENVITFGRNNPIESLPVPFGVFDVRTGDLNQDGLSDNLALLDQPYKQTFTDVSETAQVILSKSKNTLLMQDILLIDENVVTGQVVDFNRDGLEDIILLHQGGGAGNNYLSLLVSQGNGKFLDGQKLNLQGSEPKDFHVADLNNDGFMDIVTANRSSNNISLVFGSTSSLTTDETFIAVGDGPEHVAIADVNNDNFLDILTSNTGSNDISVLINNGDESFQDEIRILSGANPGELNLGLINNDNTPDLLMLQQSEAHFLIGNGDGTFGQSQILGTDVLDIHVADLNKDGRDDIVLVKEDTLSVYFAQPDGSLAAGLTLSGISILENNVSLQIDDINGDTHVDLVVNNHALNDISLFLSNGDGSFQTPKRFATGSGPQRVMTGTFQADQNKVTVTTINSDSTISILQAQ